MGVTQSDRNYGAAAPTEDTSQEDKGKYELECDVKEALKYAQLSNLAYFSYDKVQQDLLQYKLKAMAMIHCREFSCDGFIATDPEQQYFVVALHGTVSEEEARTDIKIFKTPIIPSQPEGAQGHYGFVQETESIYPYIKDALNPHIATGKRIILIGHSMGGAVATLIAYRLAKTFPNRQDQLMIYTYGCPFVGDEKYLDAIKGLISYSITCEHDPISYGSIWKHFSIYKPGKLQLLPGGGHLMKYYLEILKQRVEALTSE